MNAKAIFLYWVLLLVPTLAISLGCFQLLKHEQERIREREHVATQSRAEALGDTLQLGISAVQDELLDRLRTVPEGGARSVLEEWEYGNPLVRHAFVWRPGKGLSYPPAEDRVYNETERRFSLRYEGLFAGRVRFGGVGTAGADRPASSNDFADTLAANVPAPDAGQMASGAWDARAVPQASGAPIPAQSQEPLYRSVQRLKMSSRSFANAGYNQEDAAASQSRLIQAVEADGGAAPAPEPGGGARAAATGWMPWFSENRLDLLGWIQYRTDGDVFGVELEMMAVLSRLVDLLRAGGPDGSVMVLRDGLGQAMHQTGGQALKDGATPTVSVPLDPALPHWRLDMYAPFATGQSGADTRFMTLSFLLLGVFVAAILSGGGLLTWQAARNSRDAHRKTSFVSNVSHELKTPLTSIRMYAELMSDGRVTTPEKQKQYLSVIAEESRRLARLVNNVLDFGRLEQGRKQYQVVTLDIAAVLESFVEVNGIRLQEAGLALRLRQPAPGLAVRADRDAVEQVLLNLVDNAAKYAREGGEVELALEDGGDVCRVHVLDRGPGIPRAHRKRIFEKFHRVDNSLTASQPGSGLGLSIARGLVRDLGGDLLYKAREGGGSCFTMVLPKPQGR